MTTPTPTETVAKLIYDVADALDGKQNGSVTRAEFTKVLNTFDRLDTPNPAGKTVMSYIKGNGMISGDVLKDYVLYNVYGERAGPTPNMRAAGDYLQSRNAEQTLARATHIYEDIADGAYVAENAIWAEAKKLGVR